MNIQAWLLHMVGKVQLFIEKLYDEMEPYFFFFARLYILWLILRLLRAGGMAIDFLDWIEHAELVVSKYVFLLLLLDFVLGLGFEVYQKQVERFGQVKEEKE